MKQKKKTMQGTLQYRDVQTYEGRRWKQIKGLAERLDRKHTSKDFSCQEVMHFFLGRIQQQSLKIHQYIGRDGTNTLDSMGQIQVIK